MQSKMKTNLLVEEERDVGQGNIELIKTGQQSEGC